MAIDCAWRDTAWWRSLATAKERAARERRPEPGTLYWHDREDIDRVTRTTDDQLHEWTYGVAPTGCEGYAWIVIGHEFTFRIAATEKICSRPGVMVDIRSEALWTYGLARCVAMVRRMLHWQGASIQIVKPSRIDMCVDVLVPDALWTLGVWDQIDTRAHRSQPHLVEPHRDRGKLTGFSIGKGGAISARLYDKPREIATASGKKWMFDVWGIESVPIGHKIIRCEFQIRREGLKSLRCVKWEDVESRLETIWAYLTRKWLEVVEDKSKHANRRHTRAWWKIVQRGWTGDMKPTPSVRTRAVAADRRRLIDALAGYVAAIAAVERQGQSLDEIDSISIQDEMTKIAEDAVSAGVTGEMLAEKVRNKLAKWRRMHAAHLVAVAGESTGKGEHYPETNHEHASSDSDWKSHQQGSEHDCNASGNIQQCFNHGGDAPNLN